MSNNPKSEMRIGRFMIWGLEVAFFTGLGHTLLLFKADTRTFLGSVFTQLIFCFREGVRILRDFFEMAFSRKCSLRVKKIGNFHFCIFYLEYLPVTYF